ncbi:hypothetical protein B0H14DRAFT_2636094 [Mycena olivaceomarginata]|nr:hypothetical protein B0H14DRAFT_2636094 [Mycena olivaceomarginata]
MPEEELIRSPYPYEITTPESELVSVKTALQTANDTHGTTTQQLQEQLEKAKEEYDAVSDHLKTVLAELETHAQSAKAAPPTRPPLAWRPNRPNCSDLMAGNPQPYHHHHHDSHYPPHYPPPPHYRPRIVPACTQATLTLHRTIWAVFPLAAAVPHILAVPFLLKSMLPTLTALMRTCTASLVMKLPITLGAKPYFRGAEILNFRRISAPFAPYFRQISAPRKF